MKVRDRREIGRAGTDGGDPPRWRSLPAPGAGDTREGCVERTIGATIRDLPREDLDSRASSAKAELETAALLSGVRRRMRAAGSAAVPTSAFRIDKRTRQRRGWAGLVGSWRRAVAVGALSVLLGGVAAALTGRAVIAWRASQSLRARPSNADVDHQDHGPAPRARPAPAPGTGSEPASVEPAAKSPAPAELRVLPPAPSARLALVGPDRPRPHTPDRLDRSPPPSETKAAAEAPGAEARLLGIGLRALRQDHDPKRTLAILAERDRRFPHGQFGRQVHMVRAEALLVLGQRAAALGVLESLSLDASVADRRLSLARAELRASSARCLKAIEDFDRVLAVEGGDPAAERALIGRAMCHARGGDLGDARADLKAYVVQFPQGRWKAEAERDLRTIGGPKE